MCPDDLTASRVAAARWAAIAGARPICSPNGPSNALRSTVWSGRSAMNMPRGKAPSMAMGLAGGVGAGGAGPCGGCFWNVPSPDRIAWQSAKRKNQWL